MHVAVAHQVEDGIDTFGGEGLGEHFVDGQIAHFLAAFLFVRC
jgi:hypothetical protein